MEELKFTPSEAVWLEVQKQIQPRRDRRRLLLWWLLLPLLAGGSFGVYNIYHKKNTHSSLSAVQPAIATKAAKPGAAAPTGSGHAPVSVTTATENNTDKTNTNKTTGNTIGTGNSADNRHPAGHAHNRTGNTAPAAAGKIAGTDTGNTATDNNTTGTITASDNVPAAGEPPVVTEEVLRDLKPAAVMAPGRPLWAAAVTARPEAGAVKKPVSSKKKMEWVVTANAGMSGISAGFSPFVQSTAALDRYYSNSNSFSVAPPNNSQVGTGATAPVSNRPSDIKPDFSGGLGLSLRRDLGNQFSLEAGLAYNYYSTSMMVGKKTDSSTTVQQGQENKSVSEYYSNTSTSSVTQNINYINHYHFIEIPIRVQKQLGWRSPFSLQTGMSIGRMLGSNALQYDANKNIYYKDNSLFNKTQLTFSLGMDVRLFRNEPVSIELGPRLQYGLSNFTRKDYYGSRHLLFAGLETRVFFRKK